VVSKQLLYVIIIHAKITKLIKRLKINNKGFNGIIFWYLNIFLLGASKVTCIECFKTIQ